MKFVRICIIFSLLGLMGCAEDLDQFTPDPPDGTGLTGNIDNFFATVDKSLFTTGRTINAGAGATFVTLRESVITIPPGAFEYFDGTPVGIFEDVDIEIMELRTAGEILMAGLPTESYGSLLHSAGEFFITATSSGKPVRLRDGRQIQMRVEDPSPVQEMELWYGIEVQLPGGGIARTWDDADDDPQTWDNVRVSEWQLVDSTGGSVISGFGYECFSDSLNWINIDLFYDLPEEERTDVCVDLPEAFGNINTVVYLIFEDFNSIIALPGNPDDMLFCNYYSQYIQVGVPIGDPITFVVISEQGDDCYFYSQVSTTITVDHLEVIEPVKTDLEDIKYALMML